MDNSLTVVLFLVITLMMTLVLSAFGTTPYKAAVDNLVRENARLTALNVAGVINLMENPIPDGEYYLKIPIKDCRLTVLPTMVIMETNIKEASKKVGRASLFVGINMIKPSEITCNEKTETNIMISKANSTIEVKKIDNDGGNANV
ncbi:MAG: hypothetical protein ABIG30_03905 [Candidatus Aenigmatarchaeota archaeon]